MSIVDFYSSKDSDYSAAFQRAIDSKASTIFVPEGMYEIGKFSGIRGCLFSFYGDNPNHSNKTFLFEKGAILKLSNKLPKKELFDQNCNVFIFENGRNHSLSNIKFVNLTIDFTANDYTNLKNIHRQVTGVKIVTSRFRNKRSLKKNPIVRNVEFLNTKFINGGTFTIYGGSNIKVDGLEMLNPKIGLSVSTDEHYGLYEPSMKIKNVYVKFEKDYIESLDPTVVKEIYGFDFSELPPKRTKTYKVELDSIYVENATFCKIQGFGKLDLKNITIDGGKQGGQACFKINDANIVNIKNLNILNRKHINSNRVMDVWSANNVMLDSVKIENCDLVGRSSLIWFHENASNVSAKNLNLSNGNNSEYSLTSETSGLKLYSSDTKQIRLYRPALINNKMTSSGIHKNIKEK